MSHTNTDQPVILPIYGLRNGSRVRIELDRDRLTMLTLVLLVGEYVLSNPEHATILTGLVAESGVEDAAEVVEAKRMRLAQFADAFTDGISEYLESTEGAYEAYVAGEGESQ